MNEQASEELAKLSQKHIEALTGLRYLAPRAAELFSGFYPDKAHFIYELLQNAEDLEATNGVFALFPDRCVFTHNGGRFTIENIEKIAKAGDSDKKDQIGQFGIGFKSVYLYTNRPLVQSECYDFALRDMFVPEFLTPKDIARIGRAAPSKSETRFTLPFIDAPAGDTPKNAVIAYAEIRDALKSLPDDTLLFLRHLKNIHWEIREADGTLSDSGEIRRKEYPKHLVELSQVDHAGTIAEHHYLRLEAPPPRGGKKPPLRDTVSLAWKLAFCGKYSRYKPNTALSEQMRLCPTRGKIFIFFPAEREESRLPFHIHAPFAPDISRANIKDDPKNAPLYDRLAQLSGEAPGIMKSLALLSPRALAALPNSGDIRTPDEKNPYTRIAAKLWEALKTKPLFPCGQKTHARADHLIQGDVALRKLFPKKADIEKLTGRASLQWLDDLPDLRDEGERERAERLIRDVGVKPFGRRGMMARLSGDSAPEWLLARKADVAWIKSLYAYLAPHKAVLYSKRPGATADPAPDFHSIPVVLCRDGVFRAGKECCFPSGTKEDEADCPIVADALLKGKPEEQKRTRELLRGFGVSNLDLATRVKKILANRYSDDAFAPDIHDIIVFLAYYRELKDPKDLAVFDGKRVLKASIDKKDEIEDPWMDPKSIYLDAPYKHTDLHAWHNLFRGMGMDQDKMRFPLSKEYAQLDIDLRVLTQFSEHVGAQCSLFPSIVRHICKHNPLRKNLMADPATEKPRHPIYIDFHMPYPIKYVSQQHDLYSSDNCPKRLTEGMTMTLSRLILRSCRLWLSVSDPEERFLLNNDYTYAPQGAWYARSYISQKAGERTALSCLAHELRELAWIPQGQGKFVKPAEADRALMPDDFVEMPEDLYSWLGIGSNAEEEQRKKHESKMHLQRALRECGYESGTMEFLEQLSDRGISHEDVIK